jgi:tRNA (uracil-5-)-methyltransferase
MRNWLIITFFLTAVRAFTTRSFFSTTTKPFYNVDHIMAEAPAAPAADAIITRRSGEHIVACFPEDYESLLTVKTDILKNLLVLYTDGKEPEIFRSPQSSFRMRANFNIWRDKPRDEDPAGMYYAMFEKEGLRQVPCEIKSFPRGSVLMNTLMVKFMEVIKDLPNMRVGLFEVRFVTTQSENAVLTLCYKCPLKPEWQAEAEVAAEKLNVKIVGRSRKVKQIAGGDEMIEETYNVKGRSLKYYQTEGAFSQPNAKVCEKMLEWALEATVNSNSRDLLELYCGGGTFTAALAQNFRKVLATEISKASVELALKTFKVNGVENVKIVRLSSEEFSEAFEEKRIFQRLQDTGIEFSDYDISTVLVDPPRAGLDAATCELLCRFDKIVYISCNPETLARDVAVMSATHTVEKFAAFDQFPYTHHLEGGVLLIKKVQSSDSKGVTSSETTAAAADAAETETESKKRKAESDAA